MKQAIKIGSFAVIVAAILWSADGLLRRSLYELPATVIVFWEHVFGFVILLPFLVQKKHIFESISKQEWGALVGVSFLSGALGTVLYTKALLSVQFIPFSVVVLLQQLQPFFAIAAAATLLKERLGKHFWALTGIALFAAYFVSFPDIRVNLDTGDQTTIAALLAIGAAACWGVSTALSKYALRKIPVLHTTGIRFFFTAIFSFLFVVVQGNTALLGALDTTQWGAIVTITFTTGMGALALYYFGLQKIPASRSTLLELTWPLSAVLIGFLFLGERMTGTQILGAIALVVVMYFVAQSAEKSTIANHSPEQV